MLTFTDIPLKLWHLLCSWKTSSECWTTHYFKRKQLKHVSPYGKVQSLCPSLPFISALSRRNLDGVKRHCSAFINALNKQIKNQHATRDIPADLDSLIALAIRIDNRIHENIYSFLLWHHPLNPNQGRLGRPDSFTRNDGAASIPMPAFIVVKRVMWSPPVISG